MFTSHNVMLPDGSHTAPTRPLVAGSGACRAALRYMSAEFGPDHSGVHIADVGCLEGGYAAEFARAGYEVTGIELREQNYDNAMWMASQLGLVNLHFILGDARDVLPGLSFDVVFCCGLLYHLDKPVEFLNLLGDVTRRMLILNTHFSMPGGHPEHIHQPGEWCGVPGGAQNEGYQGHWFHEVETPWSSGEAADSFWLTKEGLMHAIAMAGFIDVTERSDWRQPDPLPWGSGGPTADRGMFVALK